MAGASFEISAQSKGIADLANEFDRLPRSVQKTILAGSQVGRQFERMENKIGGAGKAGRGFAQGMVRDLKGMVSGYLTLTAVIGGAKAVLEGLNEERERSGRIAEEFSRGGRNLATLAKNAGDLQRMRGEAQKSRLEAGLTNEQATNLQFTLESLGLAEFRKEFASLSLVGQDPNAFAQAVAKMQANFGVDETGSARDLINKLFVAAENAPVNPDEIAAAILKPAAGLKNIGASDEEGLTALAAISRQSESADIAATRLTALVNALDKQGIEGAGLRGKVGTVQDRLAKGESLRDILGDRQEALQGFDMLAGQLENVARDLERMADAQERSGTANDELNKNISKNLTTPEAAAEIEAAKEKARTEVAEQRRFGTPELEAQAELQRQAQLNLQDADQNAVERYLANFILRRVKAFGGDAEDIATAGEVGRLGGSGIILTLLDEIGLLPERMADALNNRHPPPATELPTED